MQINVIVMSEGHSVMAGTPEEVFGNEEQLNSFQARLPRSVQFQRELRS